MGRTTPKIAPSLCGIWTPSKRGSLGPLESAPQMTSRSLQTLFVLRLVLHYCVYCWCLTLSRRLIRIWLQNVQYTVGVGRPVSWHSTRRPCRSGRGRHWCRWSGHHVRLRDRRDDWMHAFDDCSGAQTQRKNSRVSTQWSSSVGQTGHEDAGTQANCLHVLCTNIY